MAAEEWVSVVPRRHWSDGCVEESHCCHSPDAESDFHT